MRCTTRTRASAFGAEVTGARVLWRPYHGIPAISAVAEGGSYRQEPLWYRNFQYDAERARGLDFVEDLASPGVFTWTLDGREATLMLAAGEADPEVDPACLFDLEARRRKRFTSPLQQAADAYVVQRGHGRTIVAGYPWFTDWGRDTFIALRGFMTLPGGLELAQDILLAWAETVSEGMVPNRFPDSGERARVQRGRRLALVRDRGARVLAGGARHALAPRDRRDACARRWA